MYLHQLGWNTVFQQHFIESGMTMCIPARVAEENKEFYRVLSEQGEFLAMIAGRIRFHAQTRSDFPAVGDWVLITPRLNERRATIETILPRKTILKRKMAGKSFQEQVIASNIDTIFIVTSLNQDLNPRRVERYLAIAWESGSQPVVLLNKSDLCENPDSAERSIEEIAEPVPVHVLSALTGTGTSQLMQYLKTGSTCAFIGSSGVGKSTILNSLADREIQRVLSIRISDDRGRHATTSRQLLLLPNGGMVIDTPGMREIGMGDAESGVSKTFDELEELSKMCRFRDCRHRSEPGCAVLQAVEENRLSIERLENYRKLESELEFLGSKTDVNIRQAKKAQAKRVSKAIKKFYQDRS